MSDDIRSLLCLKCCPKCGGAMFRECDVQGCEVECLQCGYIMPKEKLETLVGPENAARILNLGRKRTEPAKEERPKRGRKKATK